MKMTRSRRLKVLRELTKFSLRGLSEEQVCLVTDFTPHQRVMWMAGFRKGVRHALWCRFLPEKGEARTQRGGGHVSWAKGYFAGKKFVPADVHRSPASGKVVA